MNVFGSIRVSRFVVGLVLWGFWAFGRDLGFLFGAFAVLGGLRVRFMIWFCLIYETFSTFSTFYFEPPVCSKKLAAGRHC